MFGIFQKGKLTAAVAAVASLFKRKAKGGSASLIPAPAVTPLPKTKQPRKAYGRKAQRRRERKRMRQRMRAAWAAHQEDGTRKAGKAIIHPGAPMTLNAEGRKWFRQEQRTGRITTYNASVGVRAALDR